MKSYCNALKCQIKGKAEIFLYREPKDVFTNNYNEPIMTIHFANHDFSLVIDAYTIAHYVVGYISF